MDKIVATSLSQLGMLFPHKTAAINIIDTEASLQGRSFIGEETAQGNPPTIEPFRLNEEEHGLLLGHRTWLLVDADENAPTYLQPLLRPGIERFVVLPVRIQNRLFALVSLGIRKETACNQQELEQMRDFCDHLAVAFSNSSLISELRDLNLGTLYALARTVDAKSPWTAGHSVRVAQMATEIAAVMGHSRESIDDLQRAGLLHDIGKIGIPLRILDKNGPLTDEEYQVIKGHPSAGARILSPIRAYAGIIPAVEQHHERHDGRGYPHGMTADRIHPSARILALADAYDAMVSDRPYRSGLSHERAMQIVEEETGRQFDPSVVAAFRQVIWRRKQESLVPSLTESSTVSNIESFSIPSSTYTGPRQGATKEVSP
jgi:putative nucleotidyltransferase with HDIG domain